MYPRLRIFAFGKFSNPVSNSNDRVVPDGAEVGQAWWSDRPSLITDLSSASRTQVRDE